MISTRLKAILEMRRQDPAGKEMPPDAYVFGNALGQRTKSIKTAWKYACRRAGLVNFRFHDLRREAGSRWIEGGMVLHEVRDFLGHAKVSQTDTYLGANADRLHEALKRFEDIVAPGLTPVPIATELQPKSKRAAPNPRARSP